MNETQDPTTDLQMFKFFPILDAPRVVGTLTLIAAVVVLWFTNESVWAACLSDGVGGNHHGEFPMEKRIQSRIDCAS